MISTHSEQASTAPVRTLFLLTGIFWINFLSRVILAPFLPVLERDLEIGHALSGSLFLFISSGYCVALLASGIISSRISHRWTVLLSGTMVGAALFFVSTAGSFVELAGSLFVLGLAAGIYLPSGIATITSLVRRQHWGKALAVHELAPNLSFVAAPLLAETFVALGGWRTAMGCLGAASLLLCLVFGMYGKGGRFLGEAPRLESIRIMIRKRTFWIIGVFFVMGIGASLAVYGMIPLYLVAERGMDRPWVNSLLALSRIPGVGMAFLAGYVSDRLGPKRALAYTFLTTGILTALLGVAPDPWLIPIVFLQPAMAVCFFPAGFAALSRTTSPQERSLAIALTVPWSFLIGGGLMPAFIGVMGEHGSFGLGISLFGGLILASLLLLRYLRPDRVEA